MSAEKKQGTTPSPRKGIHLERGSAFSDLTIECQGVKFPAHKFIVCSQSDVINSAIYGTRFLESEVGTFNLGGFEPEVVDHTLEYMYTGEYAPYQKRYNEGPMMMAQSHEDDATSLLQDHRNETMFHVQVACLADFLNVGDLFQQALRRIRQRLNPARDPEEFKCVIRHTESAGLFAKFQQVLLSKIPSTASQLEAFIQNEDFDALDLPHPFRVELIQRVFADASMQRRQLSILQYENDRFTEGTMRIIRRRKLCPACRRSTEVIQENLTRGFKALYCRGCRQEI